MTDIQKIVETLIHYSDAYYAGNQIVDDQTYDALEEELRRLDPENSYFSKNRESSAEFYGQKRRHLYGFIGSVPKIHSMDESKIAKKGLPYTVSAKLDGTSMTVYFEDGKLLYALSRADGVEGFDLTDKYLEIIKKYDIHIPEGFTGGIRGEVVMPNASWEKYKADHPDASMQRNTGTGLLNRKDLSKDLGLLDYVVYEVLATDIGAFSVPNELALLELLNFGYPIVPYYVETGMPTEEKLKNYRDEWAKTYPLDGVVFNYFGDMSISLLENGVYQIETLKEAYKFDAETKETEVIGVEWTLQRSGKLIPVVIMSPVELSSAIVRRATANNAKNVLDSEIGIGSKILVKRSNEVIPYVEAVVSPTGADLPIVCPHCGKTLDWEGVHLVCSNDNCEEKVRLFIYNFLKVCSEDIKGVGDAIYSIIAKSTLRETLSTLSTESYGSLTKNQRKTIHQIRDNIFNKMTLMKILEATDIEGLGQKTLKRLSNDLDWVESYIYNKGFIYFPKYIGPALAEEMAKPTYRKRIDMILEVLLLSFIEVHKSMGTQQPKVLEDNNTRYYCVTGALEGLTRGQFEAICLSKNWVLASIKKAECLVTNDTTTGTAKNLEAQRLGKKIYTQKEFMEKFITV